MLQYFWHFKVLKKVILKTVVTRAFLKRGQQRAEFGPLHQMKQGSVVAMEEYMKVSPVARTSGTNQSLKLPQVELSLE